MITEHIRVRHIGSVEYISGWKVQDMNDGITVTQSASIWRVLELFNLSDSQPIKTPFLKEQPIQQADAAQSSQFHSASL